jgi:Xaa-Pro aminopeptidase
MRKGVRVRERLRNGQATTELDVKRFVLGGFQAAGLFTDHGPIVGVNANASNPHYEPTEASHAPIHDGDLVLLDLWAKLERPEAVYYDITWTLFLGANPPEKMLEVFAVVTGARDAAIERVRSAVADVAVWVRSGRRGARDPGAVRELHARRALIGQAERREHG